MMSFYRKGPGGKPLVVHAAGIRFFRRGVDDAVRKSDALRRRPGELGGGWLMDRGSGACPNRMRKSKEMTIRLLRAAFALASAVALWSCEEYKEPYALYQGGIHPAHLDDVERIVHEIAEEWGLVQLKRLKYLSESAELKIHLCDEEAYHRPESFICVATISNIGDSLFLSFHDREWRYLPIEDLDRLIEDVKGALESGLGMEFCREYPRGGCDEEHARREARRLEEMRRRPQPVSFADLAGLVSRRAG